MVLRVLSHHCILTAQVHPLVVQCYKTAACFTTCWLALLFVPLRFTWWGTMGAAIWVRLRFLPFQPVDRLM